MHMPERLEERREERALAPTCFSLIAVFLIAVFGAYRTALQSASQDRSTTEEPRSALVSDGELHGEVGIGRWRTATRSLENPELSSLFRLSRAISAQPVALFQADALPAPARLKAARATAAIATVVTTVASAAGR